VALLPWSEDEQHPLTANTWQEQNFSKKQQFLAIFPQAVIATATNQAAAAATFVLLEKQQSAGGSIGK